MIVLVVGNTKPDINLQVRRAGVPVDLTDALTVSFRLKKPSGVIVEIVLSVTDVANGKVSGNFSPGDLNEGGLCYGELVIDWGSGEIQNSRDPFEVYVRPEFAEAQA